MSAYMATVLRGKNKGKVINLHQWCNDWATDADTGRVYSLGSLQFSIAAIDYVVEQFKADQKENTSKRLGQMFWFYYDYPHFVATGRFVRQKRKPLE